MNWFGLVGGITTILLIVISLYVPWWQLNVGKPAIVSANISPIYTNFDFVGNSFTVPLLWAINLASILYLTAGGVVMLIYSVRPTNKYSKQLLGFSYRKPLYYVVFFIIGIVALSLIVQSFFSLSIPVVGSSQVMLPSSSTGGASVSILVSSELLWPFWLGVVSAAFCIGARLYHKRILPPTSVTAPVSTTATTAPATPTAPVTAPTI